jgi:hypothetical protein
VEKLLRVCLEFNFNGTVLVTPSLASLWGIWQWLS